MAIITDGNVRYRIICVNGLNKSTLTANSTANASFCSFKAWSGSNSQVFRVQRAGSTNYELLKYEQNDYALEIPGGELHHKDGHAPRLYQKMNATANAQRWFLEPAYEVDYDENDEPYATETLRTVEVNGYAYQAYFIHGMGSTTGRVLAANKRTDAIAVLATKDIVDDDQLFLFIPDSMGGGSACAVPSSGAVRTAPTGADFTDPLVANSYTLYPSFVCDAGYYQGRYRTRTRGVGDGDDDLTGWSDWTCIDSTKGGKDAYGFGTNVAAASLATTKRGTRRVSNVGVPLALGSDYDRIDICFVVRSFLASCKAVGNIPGHSAAFAINATLVKPVTISGATITALPGGIIIDWTSSWTRSCSTKVTCAQLLKKAMSTTAEMLEVPSSNFAKVPVAGQTYQLTFDITTCDGAKITQKVTATVVSEGGSGLTLTCTDASHIATFEANQEDARAWLVVHRGNRDRFVEFEGVTGSGKTTFKIPVPLGVPYKVWASYADTANDTWGSAVFEFPAIVERPRAMHFTSADLSRDMSLCFHSDKGGPELTSSYARENTEVVTEGGARPFYGMGRTTKATHKVKGVFVTAIDYADEMENFDWLAESNHIYFRSPRGFWAQGVVDTCDIDRSTATKHPVNVNFYEEEW